MACPVCDHTMQNLGVEPIVFYCKRCGTIKETIRHQPITTPRLVEYAMRLSEVAEENNEGTFAEGQELMAAINTVRESASLPHER